METSLIPKAGALLLVTLLATASLAQRMEVYLQPAPGSHFVLDRSESGSYGSRASVDSLNQVIEFVHEGARMVAYESPNGTVVAQPNGSFVGMAGKDGKLVLSWEPPLALGPPLEVGKTWTQQHKAIFHAQDRVLPFERTSTVEAFEEVAVPAGTFKAYRIRHVDTLGYVEVNWLVPELGIFARRLLERTDKHPQGPGRAVLVLKSHQIRLR